MAGGEDVDKFDKVYTGVKSNDQHKYSSTFGCNCFYSVSA